jgi:excisionase family DNA binding protein
LSEWLNVKEAAEALGLDESTVYRLCRAHKIPHRRMGVRGGRITFTREDLAAYLASCVVPVGAPEDPTPPTPVRLKHIRPQGSRRA